MNPTEDDSDHDVEMLGSKSEPNADHSFRIKAKKADKLDTNLYGYNWEWTIRNFSGLNSTTLLDSDYFLLGDMKWYLILIPKGCGVDDDKDKDYLSIFLAVANESELNLGLGKTVWYGFQMLNQIRQEDSVTKVGKYLIKADDCMISFPRFMSLGDLHDSRKGFIVADTCTILGYVCVYRADSEKVTGYVGLKNQGATCYMNVVLQVLYHIPYFRKAVYHMPTTDNNLPSENIALALQTLFYKLQYSIYSVSTQEFSNYFGWETCDDVQEFNRALIEKLKNMMKGTPVEGTIQELFEGHFMQYIECINVDFKKTRKQSFHGILLSVKGVHDVYDSLDKYVERFSQYRTEFYGLQGAKIRVLFSDFPPVLQLHLQRYDHDLTQDIMVKVNDRFKFPLELDLDRKHRRYLAHDADRSVRNLYTLHSVVVHSGNLHHGHYSAYIRPTLSKQWYKFDDERVTKEDLQGAVENQYGGQIDPLDITKISNAYVLVYIRKSAKKKIICDVDEEEIAENLRIKLKKELEEEAYPHTVIKVAREIDLVQQIGKDIHFDLVDHKKVKHFHFQMQFPFVKFKEKVALELGVLVQFQRYWIWKKRKNGTCRPYRTLTPEEEFNPVEQLRDVSNMNKYAEMYFFLEILPEQEQCPVPPLGIAKEDILIFFKLYDPASEHLRYVGMLYVNITKKPRDILLKLNTMAGFDPDEEIELYEEQEFMHNVVCKQLDNEASFLSHKMKNGHIICFQKHSLPQHLVKYKYPNVLSYLEHVKNCQ